MICSRIRILQPCVTNAISFVVLKRNICKNQILFNNPHSGLLDDDNIQSSLWFTTLPHKEKNALLLKRKQKKPSVPDFIPKGPPIISCKNEKFNHYSGQRYNKLEALSLVSKGWHSKKSKGDFFTINPITDHPAFLMTKSDLTHAAGSFEEAGIEPWLVDIVKTSGKIKPTTIQGKAIPRILSGKNALVVAETGCGKTLAYLLPMVQRVAKWRTMMGLDRSPNSPLGMVVVPNRELALQVGMVLKSLCDKTDIVCQTILGGHTKRLLLEPNTAPVDIVVATLGVISKLTTHRQYLTRDCKHLVLDEADTLFDDSFNEKLLHFIKRFPVLYAGPELDEELPRGTQVTLASATMPTSLNTLIGEVVSMESLEKISTKYLHRILPHVPQTFLRVSKLDKAAELLRLVRRDRGLPTMIFSNKSDACDWVSKFLSENGVPCERINSRMHVDARFGRYESFCRGEVDVISCTDLTSRGIDSTRVKHVINFDFPLYMADYIHRCGRTGRIGHDVGCQITNIISSRREIDLVNEIETAARTFKELHNVNNNIRRIIDNKSQKAEAARSVAPEEKESNEGSFPLQSHESGSTEKQKNAKEND